MDPSTIFDVYGIEAQLGVLGLVLVLVDLIVGRGRHTGPATAVRLVAFGGLIGILAASFWAEPVIDNPWGQLDLFALFFNWMLTP